MSTEGSTANDYSYLNECSTWRFDSHLNAGLNQNASCDAFDESVKLILFYFCQSVLLVTNFIHFLFTFYIHTYIYTENKHHQNAAVRVLER